MRDIDESKLASNEITPFLEKDRNPDPAVMLVEVRFRTISDGDVLPNGSEIVRIAFQITVNFVFCPCSAENMRLFRNRSSIKPREKRLS